MTTWDYVIKMGKAYEKAMEEIVKLEKERDQYYVNLAKQVDDFDRELTGRLIELTECRKNKSILRKENEILRGVIREFLFWDNEAIDKAVNHE